MAQPERDYLKYIAQLIQLKFNRRHTDYKVNRIEELENGNVKLIIEEQPRIHCVDIHIDIKGDAPGITP